MFLSKGQDYLETMLERAKGSALDVFFDHIGQESITADFLSTTMTLSMYSHQITCLDLKCSAWWDVRWFSKGFYGPLSLLHTLIIDVAEEYEIRYPGTSPWFFSNAINLKVFRFHSTADRSPSLSYFFFPNLVSFDLSVAPTRFHFTQLLDFLEASPALRTVHMKIGGHAPIHGTRDRVVVLPNVEKFTLIMATCYDYEIATHISCPSAKYTSLVHQEAITYGFSQPFPNSVSLWDAIVQRDTGFPLEEVTLEIKTAGIITCILTFWSSDATTIELRHEVTVYRDEGIPEDAVQTRCEELKGEIFTRATETIRSHPQLANVRRLRICDNPTHPTQVSRVACDAEYLLKSLGPLDELVLHRCDLLPYLLSFFDFPRRHVEAPVVYPPIKELTFSHPVNLFDGGRGAIIKFAKSQHASGIPFERIIVRGERIPRGMEEALRPWVGSAECYREEVCETDRD